MVVDDRALDEPPGGRGVVLVIVVVAVAAHAVAVLHETSAELERAVLPGKTLCHANLRTATVGIAGVLHPGTVDLLRGDHLPKMPGLAEEDVPPALLVVHREIEVTEVEVRIVGVGSGQVELELAVELPALIRLGRIEVESDDRVVHAEHRLVVTVLPAVTARQHPIGVDVGLGLVRVVHGLECEIAVRRDAQARLGQRLEDAGRRVGQIELRPVSERPDAARLVGRRVLARRNLRSLGLGGRLGGGLTPLQLGDTLGLRLDLGVLLFDQRAECLQVGLRYHIRRRGFNGGHEAGAKHRRKQYFLHVYSFLVRKVYHKGSALSNPVSRVFQKADLLYGVSKLFIARGNRNRYQDTARSRG